MNKQHSIIPASSAGIWGKPDGCTGWVTMSNLYPDTEESDSSIEGSAAHEIGSALISAARGGFSLGPEDFLDHTASNGVIMNQEMFDAAVIYAEDVIKTFTDSAYVGVEERLTAKRIHELAFGTIDSYVFDRENLQLYLWDFKYGFECVEVYENWQLIDYTAGIIEKHKIDGLEDQHITVHLRVIQPRAYHHNGVIREWKTKLSDLRGHINVLRSNAHESLGRNPVTRSGPHCKHCSARHACKAALSGGLSLYEVVSKPTPNELTPDALGVQLTIIKRAKKQLEYLESGFEEQVKSLIRSGKNIPGWMVEQGYGIEKWNKPIEEIINLGKLLNTDFSKPSAVITPKQARKKGVDDSLISAFSETPRTGIKIVLDNCNKAKQVFNHDR